MASGNGILRFVLGIDSMPMPLSQADVDTLQDSFAGIALKNTAASDRPQNLEALIKIIVQKTPKDGFTFSTFLVGDGSQVPVSAAPKLRREYRFVWTRNLTGGSAGALGSPSAADIMAVGSSATASNVAFLQCLAWDPVNEWFNFYARSRKDDDETGDAAPGLWVYAGNSTHAFTEGSRGKGPFDGHVSGSLVMKELEFPWNNWHSSQVMIDMRADPVLSRSAFVQDLLKQGRLANAEDLEMLIVKPGIQQWTSARLKRTVKQGHAWARPEDLEMLIVKPGIQQWTSARLKRTVKQGGTIDGNARFLLQHVLATPTVNFISSPDRSNRAFPGPKTVIRLPLSFFVNAQALSKVDIAANGAFPVPYALYRKTLVEYKFRMRGKLENNTAFEYKIKDDNGEAADTFFAFFVPAPAFSDVQVVDQLIKGSASFISKRLMACLLLVDFCNPVYSARRLRLMDFVPEKGTTADFADDGSFVEAILAAAARDTAAGTASGATEFAQWWALGAQVAPKGQAAVQAYLQKASARLADQAGAKQAFEDYTELSISRRFEFADTPLDEFPLTLPHTRINEKAPLLQMRQDATVGPKSAHAVELRRSLGKVPTWSSATTPLATVPAPAGPAAVKWSCATTPLVKVPEPAGVVKVPALAGE